MVGLGFTEIFLKLGGPILYFLEIRMEVFRHFLSPEKLRIHQSSVIGHQPASPTAFAELRRVSPEPLATALRGPTAEAEARG
jgi:hypothetical protein